MPEVIAEELEKGPETVKSVSLTAAENLQMFMGDPKSAETKAIMEAHGISFGDTVVVNVEGQKPMVVIADKEDFWTRDKAASEAIAESAVVLEPQPVGLHETADLAKMMMGEIGPDTAIETHEELVVGAIEPLGEEALELTLENAEIFTEQAPIQEEKGESSPEAQEIPDEVMAQLKTGVTNFEEAASKYDGGLKSFDDLSDDATLFLRFINGVHDTYSVASLQTALKQLNVSIQQKYHTALRGVTQGRQAMAESRESISRAVTGVDALQDVTTTLEAIQIIPSPTNVDEIDRKLRAVASFSDHLTKVIQTSYQQGFHEDELRGMVSQLQSFTKGNQELTISKKLEEPLQSILKVVQAQ